MMTATMMASISLCVWRPVVSVCPPRPDITQFKKASTCRVASFQPEEGFPSF